MGRPTRSQAQVRARLYSPTTATARDVVAAAVGGPEEDDLGFRRGGGTAGSGAPSGRTGARGAAQVNPGNRPRAAALACINHTFLTKLFFTERSEFRTEATEPNTSAAR